MKKETYCTGDRVVLPPYGVGVVCGISTRQIANLNCSYYQVEFPDSTSRAYVPVDSPTHVGMRPALTSQDMPELWQRLSQGRVLLPRQWSARHRKVSELLTIADPFEVANLVAELYRWHVERGLPDLDRQAYRRALKLIEQEIRDINDGSADIIRAHIEHARSEAVN